MEQALTTPQEDLLLHHLPHMEASVGSVPASHSEALIMALIAGEDQELGEDEEAGVAEVDEAAAIVVLALTTTNMTTSIHTTLATPLLTMSIPKAKPEKAHHTTTNMVLVMAQATMDATDMVAAEAGEDVEATVGHLLSVDQVQEDSISLHSLSR